MELIIESDKLTDYLKAIPPVIQFDSSLIRKQISAITSQTDSIKERAKLAFEFSRDKIQHSFDSDSCTQVTINAEDVLEKKEGICFAKAHVLASLLRGMGIPTGFCYQLTFSPKVGFAMHGLNAIYLEESGWFRVDPRGNKPGIDSQFTTDKEQLAYFIDTEKGEIDYPNVFIEPLPLVISAMHNSKNVKELFLNRPKALR